MFRSVARGAGMALTVAALASLAAACVPAAATTSAAASAAGTELPYQTASSVSAAPTAAPSPSPAPTASPTPGPTPKPTPKPAATLTPFPTGTSGALAAVKAYNDFLVTDQYQKAWSMLGPGQQAALGSFSAYLSERIAYIKSAGPTYTAVANPPNTLSLAAWVQGTTFASEIDTAHAVLVEVDWTALAGNNAGWEMFVANPTGSAGNGLGWAIYQVR